MAKLKVVIADDNPKISKLIEEAIQETDDLEVVANVTDGILALKAIDNYKPDLLILDIIMPNLDGIGVLERLKARKCKSGVESPKIIILSGVGQDEVTFKAMNLGASYYMIKPFDVKVMINRMRQFLIHSNSMPSRGNIQGIDCGVYITRVLTSFNLPTHTKGFVYIKEALTMIDTDLTLINKLTTVLYPSIAEKYHSTPSRVERSIRNTIEIAVDRGNKALYEKYFSIDYALGLIKVTNGDFITILMNLVKDGAVLY